MTEIFDNIRELYDFRLPCEPLRPFIEFFSETSSRKTAHITAGNPFTVEMFPSWTPTFWVNLGAPYGLTTGSSHRKIPRGKDILVLRETPTIRHNQSSDHIFTAKFFPGGLEAILGVSQTKYIGRVVPLHEILPPVLLFDVMTASSADRRITVFEDFFLASLTRRSTHDHYTQLVRDSIAAYEDANMLPNATQVAERQFVQSKTINRYFHRVIGLPPKRYFSIVRARTALTNYLADPPAFSPEEFGYYDRSHFYKAICQFTGRRLAGRPVVDHPSIDRP